MTTFSYVSKSSAGTVAINGFALRVIRGLNGVSVAATAEALDCDRSYITKIEIGSSRRVSVEFYNRLLEYFAIEDRRTLRADLVSSNWDAVA